MDSKGIPSSGFAPAAFSTPRRSTAESTLKTRCTQKLAGSISYLRRSLVCFAASPAIHPPLPSPSLAFNPAQQVLSQSLPSPRRVLSCRIPQRRRSAEALPRAAPRTPNSVLPSLTQICSRSEAKHQDKNSSFSRRATSSVRSRVWPRCPASRSPFCPRG